jgi:multidrug efflux system membrane fusion protein
MQTASATDRWLGRKLSVVLVMATLGLAIYVIHRIDAAPRTDDAYAYADTISVAPEVSGRIIELAVTDNQAVKQGDILFRIDPRPFQETLSKAQAALNSLDQEINLTQRSVDAQKLGASAAKASVERARALAEQTEDSFKRMEPLLGNGYVSAEQVDQARTAKRSATSQLNTAEFEARRATAGISGVDALVAKREVIRAEIAMAKLNLEYTTVRAPFDGRVIGLKTSVGQFAIAGHSVFTLANTNRWYIVANFRETELAQVKPGRHAKVYILSHPEKPFEGAVESVGYGVFPEEGGGDVAGLPRVPRSINWVRVAQRFPVRILVKDPDPSLFRIGASAVASVSGDIQISAH